VYLCGFGRFDLFECGIVMDCVLEEVDDFGLYVGIG